MAKFNNEKCHEIFKFMAFGERRLESCQKKAECKVCEEGNFHLLNIVIAHNK